MSVKKEARKNANFEVLNTKGLSFVINAPYCTAEEWAERTGISVRGVKEQLKNGKITEYQHTERGNKYVNVIAEMTKMLEVKPW